MLPGYAIPYGIGIPGLKITTLNTARKAGGGAMRDGNEVEKDGVGLEENHPHGQALVIITVNGVAIQIHRGRQRVSAIKAAGGVPDTDVLAQKIEGALRELPDDGHVTIKGDETFVSYPRACASS